MSDDEDVRQPNPKGSRSKVEAKSDYIEGSVALLWENSLEKLKILEYESKFIQVKRKKPFSRIHFVISGKNSSHQFEDFIDICSWLINLISRSPDTMKREQYDDPNTTANKLLLALRSVNYQVNFSVQKLKTPYGEIVCDILNFLTDQALDNIKFSWKKPDYTALDQIDNADDEAEEDEQDIEESFGYADDGVDPDDLYRNANQQNDMDLNINHNSALLHGLIDPSEWKVELERVAPKLKSKQFRANSEWRNHIVQVLDSTTNIEKVLNNSKSDIAGTMRSVSEELNRLSSRENYLNSQFPQISNQFKDIKVQIDEYSSKSKTANESLTKLTNELSEITEKIDEYKDTLDSKDSGINDTSPLVRIKGALQQIKSEISQFDLKIGVVSHSLMTAKHEVIKASRAQMISKNRQKHKKGLSRRNSNSDNKVFDDE